MIPSVAGETKFLLRVPPETYAKLRALAEKHERSVNWTIQRLLKKALEQEPEQLDDAMR